MLNATMTRLARRLGLNATCRKPSRWRRLLLLESLGDRRLLAADVASGEGESVELIVDNRDSASVTIDGAWQPGSGIPGFLEEDYLFNVPDPLFNVITLVDKVTFTPTVAMDGKYEVYARWTSHPNRAPNALLTVTHRDGTAEMRVDQRSNGGTWVELGEYNLTGGAGHNVAVSSEGAHGVTVADSVRLVRIGNLDAPPDPNDEVIVDNDDASGVQVRGSWLSSSGVQGFIDNDYLFTQTPGAGAVTFTPNLGGDGVYEVFARWTSHPNRATNTPITVMHAGGTTETRVNQQTDGGLWVSLGDFSLLNGSSSVSVGASAINGVAVADAVRFVRVGAPVIEPEITVLRNGTEVRDGGIVDFGVTTVGSSLDVNLTIRNSGSAPLTLVPEQPAAPFNIVTPPLTPLPAGQSSTLRLRMNAGSVGTFSVPMKIASNDANENPYDLSLRGVVNSISPPVEEVIVDNDDLSGVQVSGAWFSSNGVPGFFDSDYLFTQTPNSGSVTYTPNLSGDGVYEVFTRWTGHPNRATNTPITVNHTGGTFQTRVNQQSGGGQWVSLGEFNLQNGAAQVSVGTDGINGVAVADAVRFIRVGEPIFAPEIRVVQDGRDIPDGGSIDFGATTVGSPVVVELTIRNEGNDLLTLAPQALNSPFEVATAPPAQLPAGQATTMTLRLNANNVGSFAAPFRITSNDDNENPYDIALSGLVNLRPREEVIVDNDDTSGVQIDGAWFPSTGVEGFFDADYLFTQQVGPARVTFTPDLGGDGRYEVSARWTSHPNRATNTQIFLAHAGGTSELRVNQQESGGVWVPFGEFNLERGSSRVIVSASGANGVVVADAVRFVRIDEPVGDPEITVLGDGTEILDGGTVDFGTTSIGEPASVDFVVRNDGSTDLAIGILDPASLPDGFSLVSGLGGGNLQPGQSTTFTLQLDADSAGTFSGPISIVSNDSDESPYNLSLFGVVSDFAGDPEITVIDQFGGSLNDGATLNFGTTVVGTPVDMLITIRNDGDSNLSLVPLDANDLPSGFTGAAPDITSLSPGGSVVWSLQLTAANVGSFSGTVSIANGDGDENPYDLVIQGVVEPAIGGPEITILDGDTVLVDGGTIDFGSTTAGSPVDVSLTVRNDGDANLNFSAITSVPTGFEVVTNAAGTLAPGQATSLALRMSATTGGSFSGPVAISNSDSDENPFNLTLQGTVIATPEITLLNQVGNNLPDGGTLNFGTTQVGTPVDMLVTIRNDGSANLSLVPLDSSQLLFTGFSGLAPNITSLLPGQSAVWAFRMLATFAGSFSAPLAIVNGDADENPFDLTLQGVVSVEPPSGPEITLLQGGNGIADGGTVDFGATVLGTPVDVELTVRNDGDTDLTLDAIDGNSLPAGFELLSNPAPTLGPAQTASIQLRLSAAATGTFSGSIALVNNDADENPYDLNLVGRVGTSEITVLNGVTNIVDGGTVDFGITPLGTPRDVVLTIRNDGDADLTLGEASSLPDGFELLVSPAATIAPGASTTATLRLSALASGSFSGVVMVANNDANENPFDVFLQGTVVAPEITVLQGATEILDGGTVNFGTTTIGTPVDVNLTIRNDGNVPLTLITQTPSLPFEIVTAPLTPLQAGQSSTLTLRMLATAAGSFAQPISIASNDADENPFGLTLVGGVFLPRPEITLLNGSQIVPDGGSIAFGTVDIAAPADVVLTVRNDGDADLDFSAPANLPAGFIVQSAPAVGTLGPNQSTSMTLRMVATNKGTFGGPVEFANNDADENPYNFSVQGTVLGPEITVVREGLEVADGGSIDFGEVVLGTPVDVTLDVRNNGGAVLTLGPIDTNSLPAGFALVSGPESLSLAPGESTPVVLQLTAASEGTFSGSISLANDDEDESPYDLALSGTVIVPRPEITVLNGGSDVPDGGIVDFGVSPVGSPVDVTLTIRNDGSDDLTLDGIDAGSVPAGFALVFPPATSTLGPGEQTAIRLRLVATDSGAFAGTLPIGNSDNDEDPFDLMLQGTVADARYIGTALGTAAIPGFGDVPVDAPVDFLVAGSQITVLLPNGGTGTVDAGGAITFGITEGGLGICTFDGNLNASENSASGTWNCPVLPSGGSADGTWQADRVIPGEGEGVDLAAILADAAAGGGGQPWWRDAVDQVFNDDDE